MLKEMTRHMLCRTEGSVMMLVDTVCREEGPLTSFHLPFDTMNSQCVQRMSLSVHTLFLSAANVDLIQDEILRRAVQCFKGKNWKKIGKFFSTCRCPKRQ